MDEELKKLLGQGEHASQTQTPFVISSADFETGQIELQGEGEPRHFTLKPLPDLFGQGTGIEFVDPDADEFEPLFFAIEEAIAKFYDTEDSSLTDGDLELLLEKLGMDPAVPVADPLGVRLQVALRICLSLNNYSRQEVKSALRKVAKSVKRHTRLSGPRGYLNFIVRHFRPRKMRRR